MSQPPERTVYSVTRLNREVRLLLERGLAVIWVEAELSNFTQPASGHWYFTLKDKEAQIRGAMFRQRNMNLGFTPKSGQLVLVRGPGQPVRAPRRLPDDRRAPGGSRGWGAETRI